VGKLEKGSGCQVLRGGIPIGKLFGIAIRLNYSWFIIFALVTWALTTNYFSNWGLTTSIFAGVVTSLLFFASILAHELMHSLVAQASGIPVKSITLFIFGGISLISAEPKKPKVELRIALAGPLTSFALGIIFWAIWFVLPDTIEFEVVTVVAFWLGWINLLLAAFNLVPGFPLDGGRVLRAILWWRSRDLRRATKIATNIGRGIGLLFILGGIWLIFVGYWINGIWFAFIGWFLGNAAAGSYRQLALQQVLQGHLTSEIMTRDCLMVPSDTSLEKLVNDYILPSGHHCLVVADSHVLGLVSLQNIKIVPRREWSSKTAKEVMMPFEKLKWVTPNEDLSIALKILTEQGINQLPVVENGNIVGIVTRDSLLSVFNVHDKLGI
jgi:Zn-dependent protease/predicted transcriptional regulator